MWKQKNHSIRGVLVRTLDIRILIFMSEPLIAVQAIYQFQNTENRSICRSLQYLSFDLPILQDHTAVLPQEKVFVGYSWTSSLRACWSFHRACSSPNRRKMHGHKNPLGICPIALITIWKCSLLGFCCTSGHHETVCCDMESSLAICTNVKWPSKTNGMDSMEDDWQDGNFWRIS